MKRKKSINIPPSAFALVGTLLSVAATWLADKAQEKRMEEIAEKKILEEKERS